MNPAYKKSTKLIEYFEINPEVVIKTITLTIFLFIFRMSIPFFKYPFLILYFGILTNAIISDKKQIWPNIKYFISEYFLVLILFVFLIISFILSNKLYLLVFKDIINSFVLISLFYFLTKSVSCENRLKIFTDFIILLLPLFAFIISFVKILFFFDILTNSDFLYNNCITEKTVNDLDLTDYNFAILPVFFGFISTLLLMDNIRKFWPKVFISLILLLFMLHILSSGSRRGLIIFVLMLVLLVIGHLFVDGSILKKIAKESLIFFSLLFLLIFCTYFIITRAPYSYKNKILELIGSKNILITKTKIVKQICRYTSSFDNDYTFEKIYNSIWTPVFNPYDPDSGWGSRIHKTVFPLTGKNSIKIPQGSKGYLMDKTCNASYYNNVSESYSLLSAIDSNKGDSICSSVFCFVSEDFDGEDVQLSVSSFTINKNLVSGKPTSFYDLKKKGEWQKLLIYFKSDSASIPIFMSFIKKGVTTFASLKGEVIFAYPEYEIINKNPGRLSSKTIRKIDNLASHYLNLAGTKENIRNNMSGIYFLKNRYNYNLMSNDRKIYAGTFYFPTSILLISDFQKIDSDPIRRLASRFVSEDTTYYPYKSNIILDNIKNPFIADRYLRWEFAFKIFSDEYSLKQKIFGGGFNFLNWFGKYFFKDQTKSDYPHNPFLHVLLYSGIIGLLIYCLFLYKVFKLYIKYIKEYFLLFIFFLITFYFSFFSSGIPLDPPILGFFCLLPFLIHGVRKKDKEEYALGNPAKNEIKIMQ